MSPSVPRNRSGTRIPAADLAPYLRLLVVTDRELASPRPLRTVVTSVLEAGCRAVQLRMKGASARDILEQAVEFRDLTLRHGALLFINDRADVALAAGADGVHLGPTDLPVSAVRAWVGERLMVGYSTDDPDEARKAVAAGADYIGCGAVFGTRTKDVGAEAIGPGGLEAVARSVSVPVVGIGGIDAGNVDRVAATRAAGAAVVGAVMTAPDPGAAARALMAPFETR